MEVWKNGVMVETLPDPEITEPEEPETTTAELAELAYVNSELALAMIEAMEEV